MSEDRPMSAEMSHPHPALKRLGRLVCTWKLAGRTLDATEDNVNGWTTIE